jgi:hypothetical protein
MGFVFWLYIITFLLTPFLALIISSYLTPAILKTVIKIGFPIFIIYDASLIASYSLKGDYPDYCIWSLEYFFFFTIILSYRKHATNFFTKMLGVLIYTIWVAGIIIGVPGLLLFVSIEMDYVPDKKFVFNSNEETYEMRRFTSASQH